MTGVAEADESVEHAVAARVLTALLRERYGALASRIRGGTLILADGSSVPLVSGHPFDDLRVDPMAGVSLDAAMDTIAAVADPADTTGVVAFAAECRGEVISRKLLDAHRTAIDARLGDDVSPVVADARAAALGHPIHPTSLARIGISPDDLVSYAPEFAPTFRLRWASLDSAPGDDPTVPTGARLSRPSWWPSAAEVGLPAEHRSRPLFPVHPLAVGSLPSTATVAPRPYLEVRPTLSLRTVWVDDTTQLKLPIPISTLGVRNGRRLTLASLTDGATAGLLLTRVTPADVLVADEAVFAHSGDPMLAWLTRSLPAPDAITVAALPAPVPGTNPVAASPAPVPGTNPVAASPAPVPGTDPVAALPTPLPGTGTVAGVLATRHTGGDLELLVDRYLRRLLAWQVELLVRYGIALESHQQNLAVRFTRAGLPEFVIKDHDSLLVAPKLLDAAGIDVPQFTDSRIYTDDVTDLADVFVTITLHLSAAAVAFALLPPDRARPLLRRALSDALAPFGDHPAAAMLRSRTLDADRLVGKRMVTAATLTDKSRTGARDVNKCYGIDVPNYLRLEPSR